MKGDGCEAKLAVDVNNCGACGNVCSYAHATADCSLGSCELDACSSGWGNCDGVAANGCETSLTSTSHCGSCAVACGDGEACASGQCRCGSGPACNTDEYCFGQSCHELPSMTWTPTCMNTALKHVAPDYLYEMRIYGRPGAVAQKYNRNVSCGGTTVQGESWTIPYSGMTEVTVESAAMGQCFETLGEWETWAVVDGHETNHLLVTYYDSKCYGASTCTQAKSYCHP